MRAGDFYRADIEGLRGIAVLLVVLFHAGTPGAGGGFTGVDVFFVLSGYLITGLLVKEAERTGAISFAKFYARRARRLLPAAVTMLVATLIAGLFVFSPLEQTRYGLSAIASALYASNVYFIHEAGNYFGVDFAADPFLHTWSLAVEEQFYIVWPLLIALGFAIRRDRRSLATLITVVSVASFALCIWMTWVKKPWAFFGSPARAWEFGLGGLASLLTPAALAALAGWSGAMGWAGLVAVLVAGAGLSGKMLFPGPWALMPVLGTVAALVAGAAAPGQGAGRVLAMRPLQVLGRLSYSWYLWHWPVLIIAKELEPNLPLAMRLLCAAGALGLAWAAHVAIENPIRFHPYLVPRAALSLKLAGVLSALGLAAALGADRYAGQAVVAPPQDAFAMAATDRSALYSTHCLTGFESDRRRECVFGDTTSGTTLVLLGDSHAAHWFPAVHRMAVQRRWRLVSMVKAGCPTATVPVYDPRVGRPAEACEEWRHESLARIAAIRPTAVILANSVGYVRRVGKREGSFPVTMSEWEEGNRRTFRALEEAGVRTILLRDSPRPEIDVPVCLSRHAREGLTDGDCRLARAFVVDPDVFEAEQRAARGLPHVSLVDLTDLFCGPSVCDPIRRGMVVYSDDNHLTATYSWSIASAMGDRLAPLVITTRQ